MTRDDLLGPVIDAACLGTPAPRAHVAQCFADWEAVPFKLAGEVVGVSVLKGTEIHFARNAQAVARGSVRGAARAHLAPLLRRHGFLTTRVLPGQAEQRRFIERIGFRRTWSDTRYDYFMLTAAPFGRKR